MRKTMVIVTVVALLVGLIIGFGIGVQMGYGIGTAQGGSCSEDVREPLDEIDQAWRNNAI